MPSKTSPLYICLFLGLLALAAVACQPAGSSTLDADDDWSVDVGFLDFPTSASPEAQKHFLRGVAILHSFGYKQAIEQFQKAQEIDPDFALAYWGETFCYNHPLMPERDLDSPREVLSRLGATPEERAAKAKTDRERGLLNAAEVLWGEGEGPDRRIAYMRAMEKLHEQYPDDQEIAAFFSLSLLAASGPMGDDTFRLFVHAGAIALDIFEKNPDHPGAAHYIIHAFDDPVHARLALPAAYRFAEIAAAVSHARHMPSHIFIQRGMWDRVTASNDSAYQAAADLWEKGDSVGDMVHSLDWGHYGDLMRGDWEKAAQWRPLIDQIVEDSDQDARAVSIQGLLWARQVVETQQWETREIGEKTGRSIAFATGLSALQQGDTDLVDRAIRRLEELGSETAKSRSTFSRGPGPAKVAHRALRARLLLAQGKSKQALASLDEGIEIAESMGPPRGAATPVKPIHELYGEVLLELDRPEEAVERFQSSLLRTPNRPHSLLGLARALKASGDEEGALEAYRQVTEVWEGRTQIDGYNEAVAALEQPVS
ncbi:MAG: hypothetical protein AAF690_22620 [Acidobacteriota bacterium]